MRDPGRPFPPTVLVVEDEPLIRLYLSDALREADYEVVEAASADDAALILDTNPRIDLVVSDVRMPGRLDGVELALRAKLQRADRPVILASGHLAPEQARVADAFLAKPYTDAELLRLVETLAPRGAGKPAPFAVAEPGGAGRDGAGAGVAGAGGAGPPAP